MTRRVTLGTMLDKGLVFCRVLSRLHRVRRPFSVLAHYLRETSPASVVLRSGRVAHLSAHAHDLKTFVVVFLKRDYGRVAPGSVVVDVGANIGMFALYAAWSGARRVYAFEPAREAYATLCGNIADNGLADVIIPQRAAVGAIDGRHVMFPCASSPYNTVQRDPTPAGAEACQAVATVSLAAIIRRHAIERVDLLKMDCEGAEFEIIPALADDILARIGAIRMECHGDPRPLVDPLRRHGFTVVRMRQRDLWLSRQSA